MQKYGLDSIHNVVMLSDGSAGKTSLSEAMLFTTGAVNRLGKVDDGSSTSDYDPDEVKRKISINLSLLPCEWNGKKINIIDTPGYSDFVGEVKAGMRVSEGAVVVICAASGNVAAASFGLRAAPGVDVRLRVARRVGRGWREIVGLDPEIHTAGVVPVDHQDVVGRYRPGTRGG